MAANKGISEGMELNLVDEEYETKMAGFEIDCNDGQQAGQACHNVGEFYSVVKNDHTRAAKVFQVCIFLKLILSFISFFIHNKFIILRIIVLKNIVLLVLITPNYYYLVKVLNKMIHKQ
jgi:hypothetical protein